MFSTLSDFPKEMVTSLLSASRKVRLEWPVISQMKRRCSKDQKVVFRGIYQSISLVDRNHCFRQSARYSRSLEVIDSLPAEIVFIAGEHLIGLVYGPDLKRC